MDIRITQITDMDRRQKRAWARICASCGGYDAYGDDTGFPVFFAYLPGSSSPAGFLTGCHIPPDAGRRDETVEVSAAVRPEMRRLGVFTALLETAAGAAGKLFPGATLTGPLPAGLISSRLAADYLYDELLMRCTAPGSLPPGALPAGMSVEMAAHTAGPGAREAETELFLQNGSQTAAHMTLTGGGNFYCISDVHVPEELRGCGYGTLLLTHVLTRLPAGSAVVLQVRSNNKPALRLYRKTGFEISERLSFYRFDRLFAADIRKPQ